MKKIFMMFIFTTILMAGNNLFAVWTADIETGLVKSGYNDVRIPGKGGTDFSLSEDLKINDAMFYRIELVNKFNQKHGFRLLYAPLTLDAEGTLKKDVVFYNHTFYTGSKVKGLYKFNSYRLTYFYSMYQKKRFNMDIGATLKIRDARIKIDDGTQISDKTNIGAVPLFYVQTNFNFAEKWNLLCGGDMLVAPQGRAEDIFTGISYSVSPKIKLKTGYRFVEGGADNYEVYNFAFIHYFVLGAIIEF